MQLVTSDAHEGLKGAVAAPCSVAAWQQGRTHFLRNSLAETGKLGWAAVHLRHSLVEAWSLGLTSMRERIARLGEGVAIDSAPGAGTGITARVPVTAAPLAAPDAPPQAPVPA